MEIVTESDLDPRMSDETKAFVTNFLKMNDPRGILKNDVSVVRNTRNERSALMNKALNTENLELKEFSVNNINDNFEIPVTAYIPKGYSENSPLIVFIHGGGWTFCSRITHHFAVATLAEQSKCIWLSVEYRLGPEFRHPYGLQDCQSVFKWALENKSKIFNLNENCKVGIAGDSAGGNYSAVISHEFKNMVSFQILVYPCVHLNLKTSSSEEFIRDCFILIPDVISFFCNNLVNNEKEADEDPRVSPLLYEDFKNLSDALIIAAELDPLVDQSKIYHKKLLDNNNKSELHIIKGVQHGFFNVPPFFPIAFKEVTQHIVEFLNKNYI